ncbi:hypothetical protein [Halalkalibacter krulwichiae]|uniref:Uncharacterized protein n=1 Tax=Halalkalibacter krulwichiae TaxID=199441 RepID=A0A1X9MGD7_9BACI|nr:hypothetical protein [Halalkalibacter krulwichiae]ARK32508.1 hypothetical protein BkAM31D_23035 [Halalkalibacter krulwichiae]
MDFLVSTLFTIFMYAWIGSLAVVVIALGVYVGLQMHVKAEEKKKRKQQSLEDGARR